MYVLLVPNKWVYVGKKNFWQTNKQPVLLFGSSKYVLACSINYTSS